MTKIKTMLLLAVLASMLSVSWAGASVQMPLGKLTYAITAGGVKVGENVRVLETLGNGRYKFTSTLYSTGWAALFKKVRRDEYSIFAVKNGRVIPEKYGLSQTGRKPKTVYLDYDMPGNRVSVTRNGDQSYHSLNGDYFDPLLFQMALALNANAMTGLKLGIIDDGKKRDIEIVSGKRELIELKEGDVPSQKMGYTDKDRAVTVWVGLDSPVLAKISYREDETSIVAELVKKDLLH